MLTKQDVKILNFAKKPFIIEEFSKSFNGDANDHRLKTLFDFGLIKNDHSIRKFIITSNGLVELENYQEENVKLKWINRRSWIAIVIAFIAIALQGAIFIYNIVKIP